VNERNSHIIIDNKFDHSSFSPSGLVGDDKKLNKLTGTKSLKKNPAKIERDPNPKQIKCSR
jgi:hypothetical protein